MSKISEDAVFSMITTLSSDSYIFPGTVRENLMMGFLGGKMAEKWQYDLQDTIDGLLWGALEKVNLRSFLEYQEGLDTLLKEGGSNLSGGQRQRLAFARALLKDSPIYILDEATSNIDAESEDIIMNNIKNLVENENKTVILISHRLANVVRSDTIYMLGNGKIVESGSHENLLRKEGEYAKLWREQKILEDYAEKGA